MITHAYFYFVDGYDGTVDVFSFGVTLLTILLHSEPSPIAHRDELLQEAALTSQQRDQAKSLLAGVPQQLCQLICTCTSEACLRPSFSDIVQVLEPFVTDSYTAEDSSFDEKTPLLNSELTF